MIRIYRLFLFLVVISLPIYTLQAQFSIATVTSKDVSPCSSSANGEIFVNVNKGAHSSFKYELYYEDDLSTIIQSSAYKTDTFHTFTGLIKEGYYVIVRVGPITGDGRNQSVGGPNTVSFSSQSATDITCNGDDNGEINVSASGETGSYIFELKNSLDVVIQTNGTGTFESLVEDTYTVDVTDNTCPGTETSDPLTVNEPDPISISSESSTHITCNGADDGTVSASAAGGVTPYSYTLDQTGANNATGDFSGLSANTYTVTITDANACPSVTTGDLPVDEPLQLDADVAKTDITCFGANDGTITISNPSGGWGTYEYSIDNGNTWQGDGNFSGLSDGNYDVVIRDAANSLCTRALSTETITEPGELNASVSSSDVDCFGDNTGSISIASPSGGSGNYEYTIDGGINWEASGNFTGLIAGTYDVRMRDAAENSCTKILDASLEITEPDELNATVSKTDVSGCNGYTNGEINIDSPLGGSGSYQYTMNGGTN
ncbi:MAG: SprB repeat-containing protein, partial [Bacteroidales bacterium]